MPTTHALQTPPAGHESLGELVLSVLDTQAAAGGPPSAAGLVEELAQAVPGFDDTGLYKGQQVRACGLAVAGATHPASRYGVQHCRRQPACTRVMLTPPAGLLLPQGAAAGGAAAPAVQGRGCALPLR